MCVCVKEKDEEGEQKRGRESDWRESEMGGEAERVKGETDRQRERE